MNFSFPVHLDPDRSAARYVPYDLTSSPVRAYRHRLMLPRGMRPLPLAPARGKTMWVPVVILTDETRELTVGVRAMLVDREVTPATVLTLTLEGLGHVILHQSRVERGLEGATVDILTESSVGGQTYISRWTVLKWGHEAGATLLVVEARVPAHRYASRKDDLLAAIAGARLLDPSAFPFAEILRKFNRGTPGDFAFYYPDSWEISDELVDPRVRVVRMGTDLRGAAIGAIVIICSTRALGRDEVVQPYLRSLESHGLVPTMHVPTDAPLFGGLRQTYQQLGFARTRGATRDDIRVRVFGGVCGSAWYAIGSVSPTYQAHPIAAEIVTRSQEILLTTMSTIAV